MSALIQERCDHNRFADQLAARMAPAVIVTEVETIPAADRDVTRSDNGPSRLDYATEAMEELRSYLKATPVITSQDEAKLGAAVNERTLIALNEARAERETKTRPFRDRLNAIFEAYALVKDKGTLETARNELRKRLTKYASDIEAARIAEVERLRKEAEEAERIARQAEEAEREAIDDADQGVESDVGGAIEQADQAFSDFRRIDKAAAIAARNVPLRFGSVTGGRSRGMRTTEVLVIDDVAKALRIMGMTDKIRDAILSSARDYRREFDELPAGITATFERSI